MVPSYKKLLEILTGCFGKGCLYFAGLAVFAIFEIIAHSVSRTGKPDSALGLKIHGPGNRVELIFLFSLWWKLNVIACRSETRSK